MKTEISIKGRKMYHTSNPHYRTVIETTNKLIPKQETWGINGGSDYNRHLDKAIFCKLDEVYDSGYDDDIYEIDTENCPNIFYRDVEIDDGKCVYTLEPIDLKHLTLIKRGVGVNLDGKLNIFKSS